jgi:hypothetical protein
MSVKYPQIKKSSRIPTYSDLVGTDTYIIKESKTQKILGCLIGNRSKPYKFYDNNFELVLDKTKKNVCLDYCDKHLEELKAIEPMGTEKSALEFKRILDGCLETCYTDQQKFRLARLTKVLAEKMKDLGIEEIEEAVVIEPKKEDIQEPQEFAVGGNIGQNITFTDWQGEQRKGVISEKLENGDFAVSSGFGSVLVKPDSIISYDNAVPEQKKKLFGFFEEGGNIGKKSIHYSNSVNGKIIESIDKIIYDFDSAFKLKEFLDKLEPSETSMNPTRDEMNGKVSFKIPMWIKKDGINLYFNYDKDSERPYQFIEIIQTTKSDIPVQSYPHYKIKEVVFKFKGKTLSVPKDGVLDGVYKFERFSEGGGISDDYIYIPNKDVIRVNVLDKEDKEIELLPENGDIINGFHVQKKYIGDKFEEGGNLEEDEKYEWAEDQAQFSSLPEAEDFIEFRNKTDNGTSRFFYVDEIKRNNGTDFMVHYELQRARMNKIGYKKPFDKEALIKYFKYVDKKLSDLLHKTVLKDLSEEDKKRYWNKFKELDNERKLRIKLLAKGNQFDEMYNEVHDSILCDGDHLPKGYRATILDSSYNRIYRSYDTLAFIENPKKQTYFISVATSEFVKIGTIYENNYKFEEGGNLGTNKPSQKELEMAFLDELQSENKEKIQKVADFHNVSPEKIVSGLRMRFKVLKYANGNVKEISINASDDGTGVVLKKKKNFENNSSESLFENGGSLDGIKLKPSIYYFNEDGNDITFTDFNEAYSEAKKRGYGKFRDNLGGEYFVDTDAYEQGGNTPTIEDIKDLKIKERMMSKNGGFMFSLNFQGKEIKGWVNLSKTKNQKGEWINYEFSDIEGYDWVYWNKSDRDYEIDKRKKSQKQIEKSIIEKISNTFKKGGTMYAQGGDLGNTPTELKGYRVDIYKSDYNSHQNLVSYKNKSAILVTDGKHGSSQTVMSDQPYLKLIKRNIFGKEYLSAEPVNYGLERNWKMFGGTFIYSSDSRFSEDISSQPVPLHDRVEMAHGGSVELDFPLEMEAKAIEFITGTRIDLDSLHKEGNNYFFKYKGKDQERNLSSKLISDTIAMHKKSLEGRTLFEDGGNVSEEDYTKKIKELLPKITTEAYEFLIKNGADFGIGSVSGGYKEIYITNIIIPKNSHLKQGSLDAMQINYYLDTNTFEVIETQAGKNEDELWVYGEYKNLIPALKSMLRGNSTTKRRPIKKYEAGGNIVEDLDDDFEDSNDSENNEPENNAIKERMALIDDLFTNEDSTAEYSDALKVGDVIFGGGLGGYMRIFAEQNTDNGDYFVLQDRFNRKFQQLMIPIIRDVYSRYYLIDALNIPESDFLFSEDVIDLQKEIDYAKGTVYTYEKDSYTANNTHGISYSDYATKKNEIPKLEERLKNLLSREDKKFAKGGNIASKKYFIKLDDGSKKEYEQDDITKIRGVYFALGYHDEADKGAVYVHYSNALRPLFNEDGTKVTPIPEYSGKDYWEFEKKRDAEKPEIKDEDEDNFEDGGNLDNGVPKVKLATKNKIKRLSARILEISNLDLGDDIYSYEGDLSFTERRKLLEELEKKEAELTNITENLSQEQCYTIDDENFQALNCAGDYGYTDEYAKGGNILNEGTKVRECHKGIPSNKIGRIIAKEKRRALVSFEPFGEERWVLLTDLANNKDFMEGKFEEGGNIYSDERAQEIASTILMQLGGTGRLKAFVGANNFIYDREGSVSFKFKGKKANYVRITLNAMDYYDVVFKKISGMNVKTVSELNDVDFEQLIPFFERETGMYLHFEDGGNLFKGGGTIKEEPVIVPEPIIEPEPVKKIATYIPNRDIKDLTLFIKDKYVTVDGTSILDGVYLKKTFKQKIAEKKISAEAILKKIKTDAKKLDVKLKELAIAKLEDIQEFLDLGANEEQIRNIYLGYSFDHEIKEGEFAEYKNDNIWNFNGDYQLLLINKNKEAFRNNEFVLFLEYPRFDWSGIIKKYEIQDKGEVFKNEKGIYQVFEGKGIAVGQKLGRYSNYDKAYIESTEDLKITSLSKPSGYQKEHEVKAGFNAGYWTILSKNVSIIDDILKTIFSQPKAYAKEIGIYSDEFSSLTPLALKEANIKFEDGGNINAVNLKEDATYYPIAEIQEIRLKNGRVINTTDQFFNYEDSKNNLNEYTQIYSGLYASKRPIKSITEMNQLSLFEKGGRLPKDATYIKRSNIESVLVFDESKNEEIEIPANRVLNGFWYDNEKQNKLISKAKKEGLLK